MTTSETTPYSFSDFEREAKEVGATAYCLPNSLEWFASLGGCLIRVHYVRWWLIGGEGYIGLQGSDTVRNAATAALAALVERAEANSLKLSKSSAAQPTTLAEYQDVARGVDERLAKVRLYMAGEDVLEVRESGGLCLAYYDPTKKGFNLRRTTTWTPGTFLDCCQAAAKLLPPASEPTEAEAEAVPETQESRLAELQRLAGEAGLIAEQRCHHKCCMYVKGVGCETYIYCDKLRQYVQTRHGSWTDGTPADCIAAVLATRQQPPTASVEAEAVPVLDEATEEEPDLAIVPGQCQRSNAMPPVLDDAAVLNAAKEVYEAVNSCYSWKNINQSIKDTWIDRTVKHVAAYLKHATPQPTTHAAESVVAMNTDQRLISDECDKLKAVLLAKNTDYGGSVWSEQLLAPGVDQATAMQIRMGDKIRRLQRLLNKANTAQVDESIEETMLDLAGYIVLWSAWPGRKGVAV